MGSSVLTDAVSGVLTQAIENEIVSNCCECCERCPLLGSHIRANPSSSI